MAIDIEWVRENPEEAARQMDVLGDMHVDHVRHLWESRGFGGCVEFAEAFDGLVKQKKLLSDTCNMAADLADDIEQLTREREQYRAAEEAQIALREKAASRVEDLEAHCIRLGQGGAERYWEGRWHDEVENVKKLEGRVVELECQVEEASRYLRDTARRDTLIKAQALFDMSEKLEAFDQPIAANQCWNAGDKFRRQAEGGA